MSAPCAPSYTYYSLVYTQANILFHTSTPTAFASTPPPPPPPPPPLHEPPYTKYCILAEDVLAFVAQVITVVIFAYLLYCERCHASRLAVSEFSRALRVYLWAHLYGAVTSLPYHFYLTLWWRAGGYVYNVWVMLVLGAIVYAYEAVSSVPVFFLTLERCMAIHNVNSETRERWYRRSIALIAALYALFIALGLGEWPVDAGKLKDCGHYPCMMLRFGPYPAGVVKLIFACTNSSCSLYFFHLLRTRPRQSSLANRVLIASVSMEFLFSILPFFATSSLDLTLPQSVFFLIGPYPWMLTYVEIAACALIYAFLFLRVCRRPQNGKTIATATPTVTQTKVNTFVRVDG